MKAALSIWNDRIAPVFDVSRRVRIVETAACKAVRQYDLPLPDEAAGPRAARLAQWGLGVLICGAISSPMERLISAHGISVIPFVAGDVKDIIRTWVEGTFSQRAFSMPGWSHGTRRRLNHTRSARGGSHAGRRRHHHFAGHASNRGTRKNGAKHEGFPVRTQPNEPKPVINNSHRR